MTTKTVRDSLRKAREQGWIVSQTKGNHYKLEHPSAIQAVLTGGTPSDHRSIKNFEANLRRAIGLTTRLRPIVPTAKAPARHHKQKRAASTHFDMLPLIREKMLKRRRFADARIATAEVVETGKTGDPSHTIREAWRTSILRVRLAGADWSVMRPLKHRMRNDLEFRARVVQHFGELPSSRIDQMRLDLRIGKGIDESRRLAALSLRDALAPRPMQYSGASVAPGKKTMTPHLIKREAQIYPLKTTKPAAIEIDLTHSRLGTAEKKILELERALAESKVKRSFAEFARDEALEALSKEKETRRLSPNSEHKIVPLRPAAQIVMEATAPAPLPVARTEVARSELSAMKPSASIQSRISTLRATAGLTQAALARRVGVSKAMIGHYETGRSLLLPHHFEAMAAAFGLSVIALFTNHTTQPVESAKVATPPVQLCSARKDDLAVGFNSLLDMGRLSISNAAILGARISLRRRSKGLTQADLALAVSSSSQAISNIERGTIRVIPTIFPRIARALGTTPRTLLKMGVA